MHTLELKVDHLLRPLWVSTDGRIILESFSPIAKQAEDLLLAIAEPISRPKNIHEYKLSEYSLYAGVSVGLSTDEILDALNRLSKTPLPSKLITFITNSTKSFGKVKLILKQNRYWIESQHEDVLRELLSDPEIVQSRENLNRRNEEILFDTEELVEKSSFVIPQKLKPIVNKPETTVDELDLFGMFDEFTDEELQNIDMDQYDEEELLEDNSTTALPESTPEDTEMELNPLEEVINSDVIEEEIEEQSKILVHTFEIKKTAIEVVKKKCADLSYPLLEEYDFRNDVTNDTLDIDLKPAAKLRPYQEAALGKTFGNGRARSGIIVLPCGAGKTLVGVTAACTIKKSCLVLCNSSLSVEQWAREFRYWSTIKDDDIAKFSSAAKLPFSGKSGVLISTYTMIAYQGKRAYDAQKMMEFIQSREWGFLLLDEVHVVPAEMFRKTLTIVAAHAKLGLTATLVREDQKINSLNWLIGPKLYEANWMELASEGFIANVQCAEVWCQMTTPFFREYLRAAPRKRQLLYVMNPKKIQVCQYLISLHESMGDKIIVFSDDVFALKHYADKLNKPYLFGGTSQSERVRLLQQFRFNPALNTIFLSKIGDTSIDLPEATCLIQISSQYGSRRQEAQRLGRILRPKKGSNSGVSAYFYTLVSTDTEEMFYATKRQQFLVDQGYEFKIITNIDGMEHESKVYNNIQDELSLLNTVLLSSEKDLIDDVDLDAPIQLGEERESLAFSRRTIQSLSSLSGADSMAYMEYNNYN
ncbi:P-loop containing nucleoside triphosphate hydrolase protein [Globomyces pollinis-pini]|nr:P-loop containing nucleoside triphosphate hydrolase protein [Globomyces pollinis-pini]